MTKKIITLLVILATSLTTSAQWHKDNVSPRDYSVVDDHIKNGRPASALTEAKKLLAKTRTPGERMQALLCVGQLQQEITPDSFFATIRTIDTWHRTTQSVAERAVTAIVLARLLEANQWRSQYRSRAALPGRADVSSLPSDMRQWSHVDYRAAIESYRSTAWNQPFADMHAVKAKEWTPFVTIENEGRDVLASRWWNEDLLHIILADAPDSVWTRAKDFYASIGCFEPQIEDYIRRCRDSIDVCRDGILLYKDEKRVAVLQNELMRIECPQFFTDGRQTFYPAHEYTFNFKMKNVSAYTIHIYHLSSEPRRWDAATIRSSGTCITTTTISDYQCQAVSALAFTTPAQPGVYALIITPTPTRDTKKVEPIVMPMRVSPYQLLHLRQPDGSSRFAVTDAFSGSPVQDVAVRVERNNTQLWSGRTDRSGRTPLWREEKRVWGVRASIVDDAQQPMYVNSSYPYSPDTQTHDIHSLYTDRAIYRPGQTVQLGLVAYTAAPKTAQVLTDKAIAISWHTAKYEQLRCDTVTTDAFGTATISLTLPADAEPGMWSVSTQHGHATFRVEEYKRPTFGIEMEQADARDICAVDTPLVVRLSAKSFNGVPLRGARVTGRYRIEQSWWWRSVMPISEDIDTAADIDTLVTNPHGHAYISIPRPRVGTRFAQLIVNVDVTSAAGETHSHELRLPLHRNELAIQANVPTMIERSHITPWDVKLVDATGRQMPGEIKCSVYPEGGNAASTYTLDELMRQLPKMRSGRYTVSFEHNGTTSDRQYPFTLFSISDTFTPDTAHFYATGDTLPCRLHIGSCLDNVTMFVNAYDGNEVVWDKTITFDREARTFDLKPATHSDGITVSMTFVKDEHVYTWTHTFANPQPDTRLRWRWDTFRDRTIPGSSERWSGTLLRPDGTPAPANVMLTLYDASLDVIAPHSWQLAFTPSQHTAYGSWDNLLRDGRWQHSAVFTLPLLREPQLVSHHFSTQYLTGHRFTGATRMYKSAMAPQVMAMRSSAKIRGAGSAVEEVMAVEECAVECCDDAAVVTNGAVAQTYDTGAADKVQMRSDFSEEAIFAPSLRTDQQGRFTLDFTLPHSVTTWQLLGVAHTSDMMTATTRQQCVAQKEVMVQLSVPRFLRLGDEGTVTATVTNMTSEALPATLTVYTSNRLALSNRLTFSLSLSANGDTTITVPLAAVSTDDIIVTATVTASIHSDGEQRSVPVIDSRSWTTETIDLATNGTATFDVPNLSQADEQRVTLSVNPAPVWTAISALPAIMQPDEGDAISLANAYFATTLTRHLAITIPQIQERRQFALDSLQTAADGWCRALERLQQGDGSFSWFAGGHGSPFITTEVAIELAHLIPLAGQRTSMLDKAMDYLSGEVDKEIAWMKTHKVKTVGSMPLYYLYASALMGRKARQADYLLPLIAAGLTRYDLNTRALAAVIFKCNGRERDARRFITSLNEHIVTTPGRGSYFDYPGGSFTSINRKLQTLTTAIEAKTMLGDTLHLAGLRRNLLQQRRVQGWDSKLFATAAVAAILSPTSPTPAPSPQWEGGVLVSVDGGQYVVECDTTLQLSAIPRQIQLSTIPHHSQLPAVTYDSQHSPRPLRGGDGGGAWGALFIHRLLPNDSITSSGTGMTLRRDLTTEARVGDRLTQRYVITVERDYEWVRLSVPRPAALEPAEMLSGYRYQNGLSYYLSQHDDREDLFFESMPRGTYIIESQSFADRAGKYQSAVATIECLYAPEFTAHTCQSTITIKR